MKLKKRRKKKALKRIYRKNRLILIKDIIINSGSYRLILGGINFET